MTGGILITGGLGYLGGCLAAGLGDGRRLRVTTRRSAIDAAALDGIAEARTADPLDTDSMARAMEGFDGVVHLSAPNAQSCAADPVGAARAIVVGTASVVRAAELAGVQRLIYVSSVHVYGSPLSGVVDESSPTHSRHPYAWTRRAAEDAVLASGLPETLVLRLSNAVGPPACPSADCWMLVCHDLCRMAAAGGDLVLRGTGQDLRDFIAMADVIAAFRFLLALPPGRWEERLVNLASGRMRTTFDVAGMIAAHAETRLGIRPAIRRREPAPGHGPVEHRIAISRLMRLGFVPSVPLERAVADLFDFCLGLSR